MAEARATASGRVAGARDTASERVADAKASVADAKLAASERVADARTAAAEFVARQKPRLRGVSHQWAFFVSLAAGAALIVAAPTPRATLAAAIYAVSLSALFGVSALYHRINWVRPAARRWMRRLDHSMIFLLIAGTTTPFCLLVMRPPLAGALLVAVWAGAAAGIVVELVWVEAPKWATTIVYLCVGWIGGLGFPAVVVAAGAGAGALIAIGGVLYTAGAVIYARQRPDPSPATFGYHEIFHVLVIAAAVAHFAAIALYALPAA